jgi:predicted GNAT family N-acyltransferase
VDTNFGEYKFSDNKNSISIDRVCELLGNSYWANNRKKEINIRAIENSICIGIYLKEEMVGFARIVTDYATMYWLCDVIIDEQHRKNGLGKKLIEIITEMKELDGMFGILATRDAHGLYEKYGFKKVGEKYMRKDAEFIL